MSALTLARPMPGLDALVDYQLSAIPDAPGLFSLESLDDDGVRLHVISAEDYLPGYEPSLPGEALDSIGGPSDPKLLIVTSLVDGAPWVNLLAPLVLNADTGSAIQVILDEDWPVRIALSEIA